MYLLFMDCIFKIVCPKMYEIDSKNKITLPSSPIESKIRIFLTCVIYFMSNLLTYCFCFFFILNEIFDVQFQNLRYYLDINIL